MKKFHFSILICVVLCAVLMFVFVGCNDNALSRPTNLKFDGPTLTLSWKANSDALYYIVNVSGNGVNEDKNTRKNSFSLSNLGLKEGVYNLKVKACGDGKTHKDSSWSSSISFAQDADSGLAFTFTNNNSEVQVISLGRATGNVVIPDTYRGVPVTSIGENAFSGKSKLTGIVMGDNITSIGASAFYNCTFLETVTFSKNLKSIGAGAFQSCKVLKGAIEIPQSVTEIGNNAFAYCSEITSVKLSDGLEVINENTFSNCTKLKAITIPNSVKNVADSAFYSCKALKSVSFGNGVDEIGETAFARCEALSSVAFNQGLKTIGPFAFAECLSLQAVTFSKTVETVGENAFSGCEELTDVTLNDELQRIGKDAFLKTAIWDEAEDDVYLCKWFLGRKNKENNAEVNLNTDTIGIANYALSECKISNVTLPDSVKIIGNQAFAFSNVMAVIIGGGVEEIGTQAFYKCEKLVTIILGACDYETLQVTSSSLKVINEYAFAGCSQLANIEIPSSVETISTYAFNDSALYKNSASGIVYAGNWVVGCDNTKANGTIAIEEGTVGIANYSFYKCSNISGVEIPDSVKSIGRSAFYQCTNLVSVVLPSGLEEIADYTFYGCSKLALPTLPQTLKTIGRSAFYKCALANASGEDTDNDVLTIPDSVETIGDFAFYGCGYTKIDLASMSILTCGIDEVVIGNGVKHIGINAFNVFSSLKKVTLGNNVKTMGAKAFYKCELLTDVTLNDGLQNIGERAFYGCNALSQISIPNSVTSIDNYAFYKCGALEHIDFGANVQTIGDYAFYACAELKGLTLPNSVTTIGKQAFRSCKGLESIVLGSAVDEIRAHAFYGCPSLTIYTSSNSAGSGWDARFNSGYRPVVWGCNLNNGYVYSVTKTENTIGYLNEANALSAPYREGYTFAGWSTTKDATSASYALDGIQNVDNGTALYAVWVENSLEI